MGTHNDGRVNLNVDADNSSGGHWNNMLINSQGKQAIDLYSGTNNHGNMQLKSRFLSSILT